MKSVLNVGARIDVERPNTPTPKLPKIVSTRPVSQANLPPKKTPTNIPNKKVLKILSKL